tara:strand:- start:5023 stop:5790 length:768 start_codon:yes stop_codon:yes gene_type:complete
MPGKLFHGVYAVDYGQGFKDYLNNYDDLVNVFTMYECKDKYRLGGRGDGGYVLMENDGYDVLLSGGVGGSINFEKEFVKKYNTQCFCFDGTEDSGFELTKNEPNITYEKKNVGTKNNKNLTNFDFAFKKYNNIFMKLDIEGSEFDLFNSFSEKKMKKIKQMVIEFHYPNTIQKWAALNKINKTHYLIHYHANNNNWIMYNINHRTIPGVFECTYIRKDLLDKPGLNKEVLPTKLDTKNAPAKLGYYIDCPPWVHK